VHGSAPTLAPVEELSKGFAAFVLLRLVPAADWALAPVFLDSAPSAFGALVILLACFGRGLRTGWVLVGFFMIWLELI